VSEMVERPGHGGDFDAATMARLRSALVWNAGIIARLAITAVPHILEMGRRHGVQAA
jgi:hypothetical protein